MLIFPFLPAWALGALTGAGRVLGTTRDALRRSTIKLDGLVVAGIVVAGICGGWWIARNARATAIADRVAQERDVTARLNADLGTWLAHQRGEIGAEDARIKGLGADLRRLLDALPDTLPRPPAEVRYETIAAPVVVTLPSTFAPKPGPPRAAASASECDYPPAIRDALSAINVRR